MALARPLTSEPVLSTEMQEKENDATGGTTTSANGVSPDSGETGASMSSQQMQEMMSMLQKMQTMPSSSSSEGNGMAEQTHKSATAYALPLHRTVSLHSFDRVNSIIEVHRVRAHL